MTNDGEVTVSFGDTSTSALRCVRCAQPSNPLHYVDGQLLCRLCAGVARPSPMVRCPFCHGRGFVDA